VQGRKMSRKRRRIPGIQGHKKPAASKVEELAIRMSELRRLRERVISAEVGLGLTRKNNSDRSGRSRDD
jgi:hypothetical protein